MHIRLLLLALVASSMCRASEPVLAWADRIAIETAETYLNLEHKRQIQISRLRAYATRGVFPANTDFVGQRVPYFVDNFGTACAVGHLMLEDGKREVVEDVRRNNNHVRIRDIKNGPVLDWIINSGLTQEECARIQPAYEFENNAEYRLQRHFITVQIELERDTFKSLDEAIARKITARSLTEGDIDALISITKSADDPKRRLGAVLALRYDYGEAAATRTKKIMAALENAVKDTDPKVQAYAASMVLQLNYWCSAEALESALAVHTKALNEGDEAQRKFAIMTLHFSALGGVLEGGKH
jgi:hypothetical protein